MPVIAKEPKDKYKEQFKKILNIAMKNKQKSKVISNSPVIFIKFGIIENCTSRPRNM